MNAPLSKAILLAMLLCHSINGVAFQELSSLIETSIKDKEPEWRLVAKEAESGSTIYRWKSGHEIISAQVFSAESEQAASDMLHKFAMRFPVPPKARPKDLGEEALLFQVGNASGGTILFRKSNMFVHINGSSIMNARRFALHILDFMAQDFSTLLEKAENAVKTKNPSRKLVSKERETDKEVVYQWGSAKDGIRLLIFYGASEQEASEKMKFFIDHISVGPDKKLEGIGDEAYLWKSHGGGFGAIRFRKSNVFIDLVAPSVPMAEDLARSLADLIPAK